MSESPRRSKKAPTKKSNQKSSTRAAKKKRRVSALVEKVLGKIETKIEADELKPTVGDYLRLLQFREEIEQSEQPKEIKVTWVESTPKKSEPEA